MARKFQKKPLMPETILRKLKQEQLLQYLAYFSNEEKETFFQDVHSLDENLLQSFQEALLEKKQMLCASIPSVMLHGNKELGKLSIQNNKCAVVILAGGMGSRLDFEKPKGCFPLTPFRKKSLFQRVCERVKAASRAYGAPLEIAFLTSPLNQSESIQFFEENAFFGLDQKHVHFFNQSLWPFFSFEKKLLFEAKGKIARGPSGNGELFSLLVKEQFWQRWKKQGIEHITVLPIDNPLADPFNEEFIGMHIEKGSDASLIGMKRLSAQESTGLIVEQEDKVDVLEYSELLPEQKTEGLKFPSNVGHYCFRVEFIEKVAQENMPVHVAKKRCKILNDHLEVEMALAPNIYKFEKFIFDALKYAQKTSILMLPRECCFAPLKNFQGESSLHEVQKALQAFDRNVFYQISGIEPLSDAVFELAADFYYPTASLLQRWKGRNLPAEHYVEDR